MSPSTRRLQDGLELASWLHTTGAKSLKANAYGIMLRVAKNIMTEWLGSFRAGASSGGGARGTRWRPITWEIGR
eukprot:270874-Pyramimonas_sp.AAC.1